eukprot:4477261-Prymnesium_polylepis.1
MLVNDLASTDKLRIRREFQQYIDRVTLSDNPWALELHADTKLQHAVKDVRGGRRMDSSQTDLVKASDLIRERSRGDRDRPSDTSDSSKSSSGNFMHTRRYPAPARSVLSTLLGRVPVMHPESRVRFGWGLAMTALICYCAAFVPLEIAFCLLYTSPSPRDAHES